MAHDLPDHETNRLGWSRFTLLSGQRREVVLDIAERESRSLLELNPEYGRIRLRAAFRRSRRDDAQRAADEPGRGGH